MKYFAEQVERFDPIESGSLVGSPQLYIKFDSAKPDTPRGNSITNYLKNAMLDDEDVELDLNNVIAQGNFGSM